MIACKRSTKLDKNMKPISQTNIDQLTLKTLKAFLVTARHEFPISSAILFGSRARNTATENSDADVMLLLNGHHGNFVQTKLALADIAFDVMLDTGVRIDPLPIWEDQWINPSTFSNPALLTNIKNDGVKFDL